METNYKLLELDNPGLIMTGNSFENIKIQDFVNIETLRRPLVSLSNFEGHVGEFDETYNLTITFHYQFKDFTLQQNRYRIFIWSGNNENEINYDQYTSWDFADIDSTTSSNRFEHFNGDIDLNHKRLTAVLVYEPSYDVYPPLPVSFIFRLPIFDLNLVSTAVLSTPTPTATSTPYPTVSPTPTATPVPTPPQTPNAPFTLLESKMMVKTQNVHNAFLYSVVLSDSNIGLRGTMYFLTKKSTLSTYDDNDFNQNHTITINNETHYLIGISESRDDYQSLEGENVMTSFGNYFVTDMKIDENPYREFDDSQVLYLFKPFNENKYMNIEHINPSVYDIKNISIPLQSYSFVQIPTNNVNLNTTDIENDNTFLKFRETVEVIVNVTSV
jgi:hypothetical protein